MKLNRWTAENLMKLHHWTQTKQKHSQTYLWEWISEQLFLDSINSRTVFILKNAEINEPSGNVKTLLKFWPLLYNNRWCLSLLWISIKTSSEQRAGGVFLTAVTSSTRLHLCVWAGSSCCLAQSHKSHTQYWHCEIRQPSSANHWLHSFLCAKCWGEEDWACPLVQRRWERLSIYRGIWSLWQHHPESATENRTHFDSLCKRCGTLTWGTCKDDLFTIASLSEAYFVRSVKGSQFKISTEDIHKQRRHGLFPLFSFLAILFYSILFLASWPCCDWDQNSSRPDQDF